MRLNKLLVVALASMTMFSCSNDDEMGNGLSNGEKKTVVLKLDGIKSASTRSTDANTGDDGKTMSLKDLTVVLYNANQIAVHVEAYDSEKIKEWGELTSGKGLYYANVDASASRVLVLGNVATDKDIPTVSVGSDMKSLLNHEYLLKTENLSVENDGTLSTKNYVTLYDDQPLVDSNKESNGTYNQEPTNDKGNKIYKAELNIKPLISRFEVKKVGCDFVTTTEADENEKQLYSRITLKGIGLVDYYTKATVSKNGENTAIDAEEAMHGVAKENEGTGQGIFSPETSQDPLPANSYKFCDKNEKEWNWSFDIVNDLTIESTDDNNGVVYFKDSGSNLNFAYNFFPMHNENDLYNTPNIRLYVTTEGDATNNDKNFVVTTSMLDSSGNPLKPVPGKIYQFDYLFKEKNIGKWEEKISVEVTVTVEDWQIEAVQPGFRD